MSDHQSGDSVRVAPWHQNDGQLERVWAMRRAVGYGYDAYERAARRLGVIDAAWSRTATACSQAHPCHSCCVRALRALEAAADIGSSERPS